ncbi:Trehalose operon transcriptional repressor [Fusobacterium necrogenes]|uniref:Trehalose operon transcriptional repressor n=1 Tax=Fusobacterium necrogenes TaxID=858 RepID=A0A377GWQ5_9FUSO|nr:GntR family transcriptional regulator [Fusobacterium necrogenes]STO31427.1 Trehalose operon transcriptional repressor [Fusobacterium necrogenes]
MTIEEIREAIKGSKKLPKCVAVYDKLFKLIKDGEFEENGKLPTEPELAKMMEVSRMTLRQALALLQEDGIIKNIHGKGNFIIQSQNRYKKGLEILYHPIYTSLDIEIDEVELEFKIEPPSDYTIKVLGRKSPVVIFVDRWYKVKGKGIAYTLSLIPIETITEEKIDLDDKISLLKFLEESSYQKARHSTLNINYSIAGNFTSMKYPISKNDKSWLLEEILYVKSEYPIVHHKHYLPIENSHISIERKRANTF